MFSKFKAALLGRSQAKDASYQALPGDSSVNYSTFRELGDEKKMSAAEKSLNGLLVEFSCLHKITIDPSAIGALMVNELQSVERIHNLVETLQKPEELRKCNKQFHDLIQEINIYEKSYTKLRLNQEGHDNLTQSVSSLKNQYQQLFMEAHVSPSSRRPY